MTQPGTVEPPRKAQRTQIIKDEVPAPPLPSSAEMFPESGNRPEEGWPGGAEDAFDYLRRLKTVDWANHMVYLYWSPPGQRKLGPNIDVLNESITLEYVKKKFGGSGGGRFTLWVNYVGDQPWRKTTEFEIEGDRIFLGKPMLEANPTSAIAAPAGLEKVLQVLENLVEKLTKPDQNVQGILDMQRTTFLTAAQTLAQTTGLGSKEDSLIGTIRVLKELGLIGQKENGLLETIKALKELGLIGGAAGNDPVKTIEMVGKILESAQKLAGEGGDAGSEGVGVTIAKGIFQGLPEIRGITSDLARAAEFNSRAQERVSQAGGPATTTDQTPRPAQNPTITPPPGTEATGGAALGASPAGGQDVDATAFLFDRVSSMISKGVEGDVIADWVTNATLDMPEFMLQFKAFTEPGLLLMLETVPAIQTALQGKDKLRMATRFLYYVKNDGEFWPDEDDDDEPEEPPIMGHTS